MKGLTLFLLVCIVLFSTTSLSDHGLWTRQTKWPCELSHAYLIVIRFSYQNMFTTMLQVCNLSWRRKKAEAFAKLWLAICSLNSSKMLIIMWTTCQITQWNFVGYNVPYCIQFHCETLISKLRTWFQLSWRRQQQQ